MLTKVHVDVPCHPSWVPRDRLVSYTNDYYPMGRILPNTTDSEESLAQVQEWLRDCTAAHSHCGPGAASELPTRILDVGGQGGTGKVRLVAADEISTKFARYVCLSHCWGGEMAETAMLTTKTLNSLKGGILVETLPRVYQDAVHITKRLGIQYLWIDSMCILQDDDSDWDRESTSMASVYQGAFITIGATCSRSSNEGFIRLSNSTYASTLASSKCRTVGGQLFNLYVRQIVPHFTNEDVIAHPLLERAWVYQERLLSPRFLHFAREELVWECYEDTTCQCLSLPYRISDFASHPWHPETKRIYSKGIHSGQAQALAACWRNVVTDYHGLTLSFEKDRLRAVAGIADQISSVGADHDPGGPSLGRYIEGLWENSILEDLCWALWNPFRRWNLSSQEKGRQVKWHAQTWSWASIQDPSHQIQFRYTADQTKERFAEVPEFGYTNHLSACQKHVQYNYIRLKLRSSWETTLGETSKKGWEILGPEEWKVPIAIIPDYEWYNTANRDNLSVGNKVLCGLILSTQSNHGAGLVLVLVDAELGLYRRVGTFHIRLKEWRESYSHREKQMIVSLD
ncbi:heterokaryon incompatibility protein-domain-containing protein [Hypoxylon sp. FL1150]|nr:heterokaryon incompatibility protein-domain-containing protein [Hypoxylon sp. FL1150]